MTTKKKAPAKKTPAKRASAKKPAARKTPAKKPTVKKAKKEKKIAYPDERVSASDSASSQLEVIASMNETILAPAHINLNDIGFVYFQQIINERANADWAGHDVSMAAKLAKLMQREDELSELLDDEGPTVSGAQGGVVKNPTATVLSDTTSKIIALRRSLCLHAQGGGKRSINVASRRGQRLGTQQAASTQDPLLAAPRG